MLIAAFCLLIIGHSLSWKPHFQHLVFRQRNWKTTSKSLHLSSAVRFGGATEFVDIDARTKQSLDLPTVLGHIDVLLKTDPGKLAAFEQTDTLDGIRQQYAKVDQLNQHIEYLPIRRKLRILPLLSTIENNTATVEKRDLVEFAEDVCNVRDLKVYIDDHSVTLPLFAKEAEQLSLPADLSECFDNAFDANNNLNDEKYSTIKRIRADISTAEQGIAVTLLSIIRSPSMKDKLTDPSYVEVEGRFCLQVRDTNKRGLGIVHGTSNSGRTVYVEPTAVIEPTNRLKELRSRLREEEGRIYLAMCKTIFLHREAIRRSVQAAGVIDALAAKAKLGRMLGGVIPEVGEEGIIRCVDAKHPVLLLRRPSGSSLVPEVVGNTIELFPHSPALAISGPNAGGKTIVLKTAGLFALMVRFGIPIPARPGARVDFFPLVLADIGDLQSVSGDISTFSGHLMVCKAILDRVLVLQGSSRAGANCSLVLLDEVGTGTDPAQGSALAQAVLEGLVSAGARVVATTHYQRIKEMAVADERFRIAAMEFVQNRPTFALRVGSIGESFALAAARRLGLPESVLARADALVDDESRRLLELHAHLQDETERARLLQQEYQQRLKEIAEGESKLAQQNQEAAALIRKLRDGHAEEYLRDLTAKAREMDLLLQQAHTLLEDQKVAVQSAKQARRETEVLVPADGGQDVSAAIEALQRQVRAEQVATEEAVVTTVIAARWKAEPLAPAVPVEAGTRLVVLDPNSVLQGSTCTVTHRNKGKGRVVVRLGGVEKKMERHLLGLPIHSVIGAADGAELTESQRRMRRLLEEEIVDPGHLTKLSYKRTAKSPAGQVGTVDLRSTSTLAEAQRAVTQAMEALNAGKPGELRISHGAKWPLKHKLRTWLQAQSGVSKVHAADLSSGGDSVTVVRLL